MAAADEHDVSVEPYFRSRSASHDADREVVFLPVICLLVRERGDLAGIYPVTDGETRYTVEDGLERLETDVDDATF